MSNLKNKSTASFKHIDTFLNYTVSFTCFIFLILFNYIVINTEDKITENMKFFILFIDLLGLVIMSMPFTSKKINNIKNDKILLFLDLPRKEAKFTFVSFTDFLSGQALASFLATFMIFTGKEVLINYGGYLTAIYVVALFLLSISLAVISLMRFISYFTNHHWLLYALACLFSFSCMGAFFTVGLKLGA